MKLPITPVKGNEKWDLLRNIIDDLVTRETKKALASEITVNKAIEFLKIIILHFTMFFESEISY